MVEIETRKIMVLAAAFAVPFILSATGIVGRIEVDVRWKERAQPERYAPDYEEAGGWELAMVYIGSSGCAPSNADYLPDAVRKIKHRLQRRAESKGYSFAVVGVARDWNVDQGIRHLRKFGEFDEITSGRNWLNSGASRFMYTRYPGEAGTPQVVVVSRYTKTVEGSGIYATIEGRQIARKVGSETIQNWAGSEGELLPELERRKSRPTESSR